MLFVITSTNVKDLEMLKDNWQLTKNCSGLIDRQIVPSDHSMLFDAKHGMLYAC